MLVCRDSDAASWELRTPYQQRIITERLTESDRQEIASLEALPGASNDPKIMEQMEASLLKN